MKYPEINVGDKVKVYKQRGALEKEWVGDYKPDTTTVTDITNSLGQKFYKVMGESKPFIRSEILLIRKMKEDEVAPQEPQRAPYLSSKSERIIKRDAKARQKENQQRLMEKKTAIEAKATEGARTHNAEVDKLARSVADKERLKKGLSRMSWRREPIQGLA